MFKKNTMILSRVNLSLIKDNIFWSICQIQFLSFKFKMIALEKGTRIGEVSRLNLKINIFR